MPNCFCSRKVACATPEAHEAANADFTAMLAMAVETAK